jgi:hypothetical protein
MIWKGNMEITLVIKKSGSLKANCSKTTKSFKHKDIQLKDIYFIDKFPDIKYGNIKTEWWIILYDDEFIETRLLETFEVVSNQIIFDAFSFYKIDKEQKVTLCPRLFRNWVQIESERLYPSTPVKMEAILDGLVREH